MMNDNPLISVIIPVYNVRNYLNKCLESVLQQTYKNLEIILVDDGSTDGSENIVEEYSQKDSRIKVIHQVNGGLSRARNTGLDVMKGSYVTFVDSDDYITPDYVEYLFNLIKQTDFAVKLSLCSLMNHFSVTDKNINCGDDSERLLSGEKCIEMMCYHNLVDTCAYAKLAKKELYDQVRFPEGKLFEDIATTYQLFLQCDKVACGFKPKYFYNIRSNSIVTSQFSRRKLELNEMTDSMAREVNKRYPRLSKATLRRQVYARFSTLNQSLNTRDVREIQRRLVEYIKRNKKAVLQDSNTPKRDRVAYLLLSFGLPVYKVGWNIYEKIKGIK
ncbi:hypothetical protein FC35_GL000469 [Limosilactobacillus coleohominis DSM 14060]|nr:hypothetical protein FC35_GL000469 [Limosilactobacillus coleohominis DSM 14060]